jgi:hypothetical protein
VSFLSCFHRYVSLFAPESLFPLFSFLSFRSLCISVFFLLFILYPLLWFPS